MRKLLKVSGFVRIETKSKKPTEKIFFYGKGYNLQASG